MNHFGEHLTFDGYGGDSVSLDTAEVVLDALKSIVTALGMNVLGGPEVYLAEPNGKKDAGGWTGFVVLQESHISIHTFSAAQFVSADVYTCKHGLDRDLVAEILRSKFNTREEDVVVVKRGLRYQSELSDQIPST
jgi:S-adenosylmethionine decarboxylase